MTEIVYLPLFKKDLQEIYRHIHDVLCNEVAADSFIKAVEEAINNRSFFPFAAEPYRSKINRYYIYYRIYVDNYIIFYTVAKGNPSVMDVHRIIYAGRNIVI